MQNRSGIHLVVLGIYHFEGSARGGLSKGELIAREGVTLYNLYGDEIAGVILNPAQIFDSALYDTGRACSLIGTFVLQFGLGVRFYLVVGNQFLGNVSLGISAENRLFQLFFGQSLVPELNFVDVAGESAVAHEEYTFVLE